MLGNDVAALLDAYGVKDAPLDELDLAPRPIGRACRKERSPADLAP